LVEDSVEDSDRGLATEEPQAREEGEGGSREPRPRRRRSRRGRGRREGGERTGGGRAPAERQEQSVPVGAYEERDDAVDEHEFADDLHEDMHDLDEGDEGDADQPARLGFRGIPTWDEVVGMMIDKNVEARARRPAGGPHHGGRGNRGPRDNRGGNQGGKRRS
jgi:hypothetical protein